MPTPFVAVCPHCETKLKLKDPSLVGKTARCPACQEKFTVKNAGSVKPRPKSKSRPEPDRPIETRKRSRPAPEPEEELDPWLKDDLGDFEDVADTPPPSAAGTAPPPVRGVSKKRKKSSSGSGTRKRKKPSVDAGQVAWIGWVVGGSVAGLIGASIWGAVAAFTFYESGIIAWMIGGFVGFGVRVGAREEDVGMAPALTAVGISIACIVLGKFLAVHFLMAQFENMVADLRGGAEAAEISEEETIEWIISDYADEVAYEWEEDGLAIEWPDWETMPEDATIKEQYPADIWAAAEGRWNDKSDEEKAAEILAYQSSEVDFGDLEADVFAESFGALDILWFILASITAFRVGSGLDFGDDE